VDSAGRRLDSAIANRAPKPVVSWITRFTDFLARKPLVGFLLFLLLVGTRAIHWLANPQFFIEDGPEFYAPAFNHGISTLTREYASYLHLAPRILSLIATTFPVRLGPLVMELFALAIQAGAATFILSNRLAKQIPSTCLRFGIAFFVIGYPYSDELFGNVAHSQWYLAIISLGIVFAETPKVFAYRLVDSFALGVNCLTGPFAPVVAIAAWTQTFADRSKAALAAIATTGTLITAWVTLSFPRAGLTHVHRYLLIERMIVNQVVTGSLMGLRYLHTVPTSVFFDPEQTAIALFCVIVLIMGLRKSPPILKAFGGLALFASVSSLLSQATWFGLGNPGMGERYFFFLGLAFLFSIYSLSVSAKHSLSRWFYRCLLACATIAVIQNWVYDPPFKVLNYGPQIAKYKSLKAGEFLTIDTPCRRELAYVKWKTVLRKR
jgi:hypothetical protein